MGLFKGIALFLTFILGIIVQPILWLVSRFVPEDKTLYYHNKRKFTFKSCSCDDLWHASFESEVEYQQFDKELLKSFMAIGHTKHYVPKSQVKFLFYEFGAQDAEGGFIFECKTCRALWELSIPDHANRGYFKAINMGLPEMEEYLDKETPSDSH